MPIPITLALETLRPDHAEEMFPGLSDPAGYRFLSDEPPGTIEVLRHRYALQTVGPPADGTEIWLNWVVRRCRGGDAVGYTQATIRGGSALLGYQIFPGCWNRGFGGQAVRSSVELLFARPDVREIRALVDTRNRPSIALLRRLGFDVRRTVVAADHFKGADSDEHEFGMSGAEWRVRHPSRPRDGSG